MPGLFDGIEMRSQQEILRERAQQQAKDFESTVPENRPQSEQAFYRLGGMLGRGLSNRFNKQTLPESQQNQVDAVASAKSRFEQYKKDTPDATVENQGLEWQKYLAEELIKRGDPQGAMLASAYADSLRARTRADQQAVLVGLNIDAAKNERDFWNVTNTLKPIWLKGATNTTQAMMGFINKDGSATYTDPDTGQAVTVPSGGYSWVVPNKETGRSQRFKDLGITPTARSGLIQMNAAIGKQLDAYMNMHKILADNISEDGTIDFMSKAGTAQSVATNWTDSLMAIGRAAGSVFGVEGENDLSKPGAATNYVRENNMVNDLKRFMPERIASNANAAEMWASQMVQLAFGRGTAAEPNQRAMTDQDFKVQVEAIAAASSNPNTFRQVALQNVLTDVNNYETILAGYDDEDVDLIISPKARGIVQTKLDKFHELYDQDWGNATVPGPGLTGKPTESDEDFLTRALR